eukprot:4136832-Pyramimonas_sp.AAC.1
MQVPSALGAAAGSDVEEGREAGILMGGRDDALCRREAKYVLAALISPIGCLVPRSVGEPPDHAP